MAVPRTERRRRGRLDMRLQGRAALVTGGSSGIGAAIAEELAAQGASVTISYFKNPGGARSVVERIEQLGRQAIDVRADVRRKADVEELFRRHLERFGRLDILVNNAGDMVQRMPTTETPETVWRDALDLNLSSVFFCCQEALPRMTAQGWGRIINISSVGARTGGGPGAIPYHAAKAGVIALTRGLAKEVAAHQITVNAITPGIIETPFHARHTTPAQRAEWIQSLVPLGRPGRPEEVANLVAFVASDEAGYITGATLDINGGMAMY